MMHVTESFAYVTQAAHFVAHQAEVSGFTAAASMYIEQAKGTALSKTVLFYVGQAQASLWAQTAGKVAVNILPQLTTLGLELGTIGLGVTSLGALGVVCVCIIVHKKRITRQSTSTLPKQNQQPSGQEKNSTDERKDTSTAPKDSSQNTNINAELAKSLEECNKKDSPDQAFKNTEGEEPFKREVPLQTRKKLDLSQFQNFEKEYEKTRSNPPSATSFSSDAASSSGDSESSSSSSSPSSSGFGGLFNSALIPPSPPPPPPEGPSKKTPSNPSASSKKLKKTPSLSSSPQVTVSPNDLNTNRLKQTPKELSRQGEAAQAGEPAKRMVSLQPIQNSHKKEETPPSSSLQPMMTLKTTLKSPPVSPTPSLLTPPKSPPQSPVASTQTAAPPKSPIELFEEDLKKEIASIITKASAAVPSIPESSSFTATLLFPPLASATEPVEKITPWGALKKAAPPTQKEKPVDTSIDPMMQERLALRKKIAEEADALREEARQKQAEELAREKAAKEAAESRAKIEMALYEAIEKLDSKQRKIVIKTHEAYKNTFNSSAPLTPRQINLLINTALETPSETESDNAEYHRAPFLREFLEAPAAFSRLSLCKYIEREMHPSPPITRAAEFAKPVENDGPTYREEDWEDEPTYREEDWEDEPDSMNESGVRANKEEDAIYAKLQIKLDQPGRLSKEAIEAFSLKLGQCKLKPAAIAPQNSPTIQIEVESKFKKQHQPPMQTDVLTILQTSLAKHRNNIEGNDE